MQRTRLSTEPTPPPQARCARYGSPPPCTASVACSTCGSLGSGPVVHDARASAKTMAGSERLRRVQRSPRRGRSVRSRPGMLRPVFHHAGADGTSSAGTGRVTPKGGLTARSSGSTRTFTGLEAIPTAGELLLVLPVDLPPFPWSAGVPCRCAGQENRVIRSREESPMEETQTRLLSLNDVRASVRRLQRLGKRLVGQLRDDARRLVERSGKPAA